MSRVCSCLPGPPPDLFSSNIDSTVLFTRHQKAKELDWCFSLDGVFSCPTKMSVHTHIQMCTQSQTRKSKQLLCGGDNNPSIVDWLPSAETLSQYQSFHDGETTNVSESRGDPETQTSRTWLFSVAHEESRVKCVSVIQNSQG